MKREKIQKVRESIKNNPLSMRAASREAGMPFTTFVRYAKELGIYKPNQFHTGRMFINGEKGSIPFQEVLEGKHPTYNRKQLKKRLLVLNILEEKCDECGLGTEWNGKEIVLELDHINGVNNDHRLENIRILCPNCHSQTTHFKGRNINYSNRVSDNELVSAIKKTPDNVRKILLEVGLGGSRGNYERVYDLKGKFSL